MKIGTETENFLKRINESLDIKGVPELCRSGNYIPSHLEKITEMILSSISIKNIANPGTNYGPRYFIILKRISNTLTDLLEQPGSNYKEETEKLNSLLSFFENRGYLTPKQIQMADIISWKSPERLSAENTESRKKRHLRIFKTIESKIKQQEERTKFYYHIFGKYPPLDKPEEKEEKKKRTIPKGFYSLRKIRYKMMVKG